MQDLIISPGFRHSKYSSTGAVNAWKVDLLWSPVDDLRFRGSYQRAIRAPSVVELFNQPLVGLIQLGNDPCAPSAPGLHDAPNTLAQCLNTVSPAQVAAFTAAYNAGSIPNSILGQLSQRTGGNADLQPEKSKSYSVGLVLNPAALPAFTGSVDYWNIKLNKSIGVIGANVILSNCLASGDPAYCSQIVRQPNTFSLTGNAVATGGYIIQQNFNIGTGEVSGIDLQTSYKLNLPRGALRVALNGSYLLKNATQPLPGAHTYDCTGLFGSTCQTINPRWRHILGLTWQTPIDLDVGLNWRFISKVKLDNNDSDETLHFASYGTFNSFAARMPNMSYVDLNASWHALKVLEVRAGINNVLDKDPPLATFEITSGGAANTYSTYEALGRQLFLAVSMKF
jgi:outer membrane receptor protein involved in Fe transport